MAKTKSEKYEKGELDIIKAIENTKLEIETAFIVSLILFMTKTLSKWPSI